MNPKLFFVPIGISGISYYERLIPYLDGMYDVGFLLIGYDNAPLRQMIEYCRQKNYTFYTIDFGQKSGKGIRIPFVSPIRKMLAHKDACRKFLKTMRPVKIVFNKTTKPYGTMAHEANRLGVETIILQCALMAFRPQNISTRRMSPSVFISRTYYRAIQFLYDGIGFLNGATYPASNGRAVTPRKLGAIDGVTLDDIMHEFNPAPKEVRVVGTIEMQEVHDMRKRAFSDALFKEGIQKKYSINPQKITVLVLGFRLTRAIHIDGKRSLTEEEHIAHFKNIFVDIQNIFREKANIIFKMHPGDGNADMYESYKSLRVALHGDDVKTDELISVSDLCIIDPWTAANYLVLASGIPTICADFAPVQGRIAPKENFRIKKIIDTRKEFVRMLQDFRDGALEEQYDRRGIDAQSIEKIIRLINVH